MKLFIKPFAILFLLSNLKLHFQKKNKNKGNISKLEKVYKECSDSTCFYRKFDESCIYSCISLKCFKLIYDKEDYILEFGEFDFDKKSEFERCYYDS